VLRAGARWISGPSVRLTSPCMGSIRLRQIALVTHDLAGSADQLHDELGLQVPPFPDPIVGDFGLENRVFEAGDCFLEILTPIRPDTAGGRYLERRGGDAAYMAMFQVDDLAPAQKRVADLGVRIVWEGGHPDILGMHLHPQDVPGAIVSFEWAEPYEAWRWGGPRWTGAAPTDAGRGGLRAITVGAVDPAAMAARWAEVLDVPVAGDGTAIVLADAGQELRFIPVDDRRSEGISQVDLDLPCNAPFTATIAGTTFVVSPC
jgi:hypothetical protein